MKPKHKTKLVPNPKCKSLKAIKKADNKRQQNQRKQAEGKSENKSTKKKYKN